MQKLCCVCTRQQYSASLDYFVTSLPPYLHQFSTISGGNCIKTATYGSEFVAAKTATEQIMDIRQALRYLGAPINTKSFLFGDNRSVLTSATLTHSTLIKRHNILAFHRVREAIAAKLMAFYWIQSAYNLSDMRSTHWDHPTVYSMILKLLITRGNMTLVPREATQEKEKEILNPQPKN